VEEASETQRGEKTRAHIVLRGGLQSIKRLAREDHAPGGKVFETDQKKKKKKKEKGGETGRTGERSPYRLNSQR